MKKIPSIGFGTWELRKEKCTLAVQKALDIGYRHIDTAFNYDNQTATGEAIRGFDRDQLFLTSKVMLSQGDVEVICELSLKELGVDYLDSYLIHWPDRTKPMWQVVEQMERLKRQGKVLQYGVSNFTVSHLNDMKKLKANVFCNQVEFHPYLYQKELWQYCRENHIELVAYRPLGKGKLLEDFTVCQIAKKYQKSSAQILLRWLYQKEIPFVTKASSEVRLRENFSVTDFSLQEEDMLSLDALNQGKRFCNQSWSDFDY
ncbi:MAG: aldo/keto reductase [Rhabdochlamydiaceae bacterium]|nr:aldo/keto reductase [Rhabdochlamydiaceae bacterium]